MAIGAPQDSWTKRTRYIADLVDADAVAIAILSGGSGCTIFSSHNLEPAIAQESCARARAMLDQTVGHAAVRIPLDDGRTATDLYVVPLLWEGNVVGSVSALRAGRPWGLDSHKTLTRSAELIALELAETHARQWWQRTAQAWQHRIGLIEQVRRELSGPADATSLVEAAAQRVALLSGATGASVMLLEDGQLVVRSTFGPHENAARSARRRLGEGISGWVAQNAESLVLRGRVEDPRFSGVDPSIEESLVVPLRFGDRIVGVVATRASRPPDAFGAERLRDLDLVAGELAILLARWEEVAARTEITTRLESDRREAIAMFDLARLAGIGADPQGDLQSAARLIAEAFAHERVAIWILDLDRGRLALRAAHGYGEVLPSDLAIGSSAVVDSVLADQRPQRLVDPLPSALQSLRADSLVLAPIVVAGQTVGLVALGRVDRAHAQFDFVLAGAIADTLSSLVRREHAEHLALRSAEERREIIARMQGDFANEMARVVFVLDACQRLLGQDRGLPTDLARAARDARSALDRLGIPMAPAAVQGLVLSDTSRGPAMLGEGTRSPAR